MFKNVDSSVIWKVFGMNCSTH